MIIMIIIMKNFNMRNQFPWSSWFKALRTAATCTLTWIAHIQRQSMKTASLFIFILHGNLIIHGHLIVYIEI